MALRTSRRYLDAIYPLLLGIVIILAISYVVYAGQRQYRLALQAEKKFIELSLNIAPRWIPDHPESVLVIHLETKDQMRDVVEALNQVGPDEIIYHSDLLNENKVEQANFSISTLNNHEPPAFLEAPCEDLSRNQTECSYLPTERYWTIQHILNLTSAKSQWFSGNLTSPGPSYLLNLPKYSSLKVLKWPFETSILRNLLPKKVFIGLDFERPYQIHQFFHPIKLSRAEFHGMIQLLSLEKRFVSIVPLFGSILGVVIGMLLVGMGVFIFGNLSALFLLFGMTVIFPIINAVSISTVQYYLPIFDILFLSSLTFLAAGTIQLSLTKIKQWQILEQTKAEKERKALQQNFIAILSHNLNTPIARMLGLIELMASQQLASEKLKYAKSNIIKLGYAVKGALFITALKDQKLRMERKALRQFAEIYKLKHKSLLEGLGISLSITTNKLGELEHLPVLIDEASLDLYVTAAILARPIPAQSKVRVSFNAKDCDEKIKVEIIIDREVCQIDDLDLFQEFMEDVAMAASKVYGGHVNFNTDHTLINLPLEC